MWWGGEPGGAEWGGADGAGWRGRVGLVGEVGLAGMARLAGTTVQPESAYVCAE